MTGPTHSSLKPVGAAQLPQEAWRDPHRTGFKQDTGLRRRLTPDVIPEAG